MSDKTKTGTKATNTKEDDAPADLIDVEILLADLVEANQAKADLETKLKVAEANLVEANQANIDLKAQIKAFEVQLESSANGLKMAQQEEVGLVKRAEAAEADLVLAKHALEAKPDPAVTDDGLVKAVLAANNLEAAKAIDGVMDVAIRGNKMIIVTADGRKLEFAK